MTEYDEEASKLQSARTRIGIERAKEMGRKLGRPKKVTDRQIRAVLHLGTTEAARKLNISRGQYIKRRRAVEEGMEL